MKVLWLSATPALLNESVGTGGYGGSGWIASLQRLVQEKAPELELAIAFITPQKSEKKLIVSHVESKDGATEDKKHSTIYYPIYQPEEGGFKKILKYYGGYKKHSPQQYVTELKEIISDFRPDIIHLFGIENKLATILGHTDIPVIVHLQGILSPCDNAFFPPGINEHSFQWPPTLREWILRNGNIYAKKSINVRAKREIELFKKVQYCMGRTHWDFMVSQLLAPNSHYYKVNEVLRTPFYENEGKWKNIHNVKAEATTHSSTNDSSPSPFAIVSVISETNYKGLDLILKTAQLLKQNTSINFVWHIVGIDGRSRFVHFFEKSVGVTSKNVNISYKGVMNAEELVAELLESSLYVHPSYIDNSPNSVCEAQILGLPIIATNVGGVSTLLAEGEAGILVPSNAPYELVWHIKELSSSDKKRDILSQNGHREALLRHDRNSIAHSLIKTYQEVANSTIPK